MEKKRIHVKRPMNAFMVWAQVVIIEIMMIMILIILILKEDTDDYVDDYDDDGQDDGHGCHNRPMMCTGGHDDYEDHSHAYDVHHYSDDNIFYCRNDREEDNANGIAHKDNCHDQGSVVIRGLYYFQIFSFFIKADMRGWSFF